MPNKSFTAKLRKDIKKIAEQNLRGESIESIAKRYNCSRALVIRVMYQELPEEFYIERSRRRVRAGKQREEATKPESKELAVA